MAQSQGWVRRYFKAFCKGFFVAVPVAVTFLDRVACVARVEGASMQPSLNPGGSQSSDVVLLNHWKVRNFEVQRGDVVSLVSFNCVCGSEALCTAQKLSLDQGFPAKHPWPSQLQTAQQLLLLFSFSLSFYPSRPHISHY
ncbi:mitochondrial inner membrane protease subunit 2 isoform X2 [Odocoileus virginianus]|uniref:Mitochondrial inner membrane protease subunit 2 isoform X2 n=1 Tax=Odocoileus virginianus TaxID=9874 RepID=A0ABM4I9X3_ODOVR